MSDDLTSTQTAEIPQMQAAQEPEQEVDEFLENEDNISRFKIGNFAFGGNAEKLTPVINNAFGLNLSFEEVRTKLSAIDDKTIFLDLYTNSNLSFSEFKQKVASLLKLELISA